MSGQPWSFLVSVNGVGGQVFGRNNVLIADDTGLTGTISGTVGGENVYLVAVPRTGYVFDHWNTEGGNYTFNPMDQPMPYTGNYHAVAYFVPQPVQNWNLTISAGAGGSVSPSGTITGASGTATPSITASPDATHVFSYWLYDGTTQYTENPISITIPDALSHTLQAVFVVPTPENWLLTLSATTGGTTNPAIGGAYPDGTVVSVQANPALGYAFSHWMLDNANVGATNPYPVTMNADHVLLAVFIPTSTETWDWKDEFTSQTSRWNWIYRAGTGFKRLATKDGLSVAEIGITSASVSTQYSDDDLQGFVVVIASNKTIILEGNLKFSFSPESPTVGTWGFGFWDSSIGQTVWFLGCSPESDADMRGFRAIMTGAGGVFLVNQLINVDQTQWHRYRLEISGAGVIWKVDGAIVAETSSVPTGSMGSAIWNDNGVVINHQQTGNLNASIDEMIWIDYVAYKETTVVQDYWHLAISAGIGGTVSPTSATGLTGESTPAITATPDATHNFDHWILDGSQLAEIYNPITIQINDVANHTLQAVFTPKPQGGLNVDANLPSINITVVKVS